MNPPANFTDVVAAAALKAVIIDGEPIAICYGISDTSRCVAFSETTGAHPSGVFGATTPVAVTYTADEWTHVQEVLIRLEGLGAR